MADRREDMHASSETWSISHPLTIGDKWTAQVVLVALCAAFMAIVGNSQAPQKSSGPLSPNDELATFRTLPGFKVELVACEPDIVDPVAMAFDERGRMFVAEMRGYPNGGIATGQEHRGRIQVLEDKDGDGYFETCSTFAEGLRFPTSVMPYKGGLLVANAPDLSYFEDTDGDGRADKSRILYTGFALDNIQQLLNSLQWGLDNWVHGCAGNKGGTIHCPEKPGAAPVVLRGRGIRFHPDIPGSLEPTSGGGQFGLTADAFGRWFTATNNQHLRQIVVPDQYLRRNSNLAVSAVTTDIPDHGAACQVFRISSFESWRVERTQQRLGDPKYAHWPSAEKVPGGYITSGCSPLIYTANRFPSEYRGDAFVCDPANNLIHRDRLTPNGVTFLARRVDQGREFLASSDNWFRPVWLTLGPDGVIYVLDFYREVIETPLSLPDDIKKKLNLETRGRGRIWRIAPDDGRKWAKIDLHNCSTADLVQLLGNGNSWQRLTAQRLMVERQDQSAATKLAQLAYSGGTPETRVHALRTLQGLGKLTDDALLHALSDTKSEVVEQALEMSEDRLAGASVLRPNVFFHVSNRSDRVRFQLALTLGAVRGREATNVLCDLLALDGGDPWIQTAALASTSGIPFHVFATLVRRPDFLKSEHSSAVLTRLAAMIGAEGNDAAIGRFLTLLGSQSQSASWSNAALEGFGQGLQHGKRSLRELWDRPPAALADSVKGVMPMFRYAAEVALDQKANLAERGTALRRLGYGPFAIAEAAFAANLGPVSAPEIQLAAVRALAVHDQPRVADFLLAHWSEYGPAIRREVVEALCARPNRVVKLLDAVEAKRVSPSQIELARRSQLVKHPNAAIRTRASALLTNAGNSDRRRVIASHQSVLDLPTDISRGQAVFTKNCATCHKLGNVGFDVGPELHGVLGNKTKEALLVDILDPNREVDPRYVNYQAVTSSGRILTGLLAVETPASITLRRADKAEDTILRSQLDSLEASSQSLMPDEWEKTLSKQDLADVIAFLVSQVRK